MKLALEAQELWRNDPLFTPHYHETGMLFAENVGKGPACLENYRLLGKETGARLMSIEDACAKFPEFKDANWCGVEQAYFNPMSGWVDGHVLGAVIRSAIDHGVVYVEATVEKLLFSLCGRCIGAITDIGQLTADTVVLCAGAMTAKLLADTAPEDFNIQAGQRIQAAAAVSCTVRVAPEKWEKYRSTPVFANVMSHTSGSS
jgi:sarcosine oxidase/L-pipecolate oxidase